MCLKWQVCWLAMVLNVLTVLTILITNKNAILLASKPEAIAKLGIIENNLLVLELYGCSFQAPYCLTCTWTDENTLCSLIQISISGAYVMSKPYIETYNNCGKCFRIYFNVVALNTKDVQP